MHSRDHSSVWSRQQLPPPWSCCPRSCRSLGSSPCCPRLLACSHHQARSDQGAAAAMPRVIALQPAMDWRPVAQAGDGQQFYQGAWRLSRTHLTLQAAMQTAVSCSTQINVLAAPRSATGAHSAAMYGKLPSSAKAPYATAACTVLLLAELAEGLRPAETLRPFAAAKPAHRHSSSIGGKTAGRAEQQAWVAKRQGPMRRGRQQA